MSYRCERPKTPLSTLAKDTFFSCVGTFLRSSQAFEVSSKDATFLTQLERFVLALDHERKPLAFRIEEDRLVGVAPPKWRSLLSGCFLEEIRDILEQDQVP